MNPTCITCGTTHDGEFCPKPPQPVLSKDSKPMINKPAEEAFKTATTLTRLHAKLDVAKDAIACALDELPASFDEAQFKRINEIRNTLHQEMSRVFEFSKAEAKRICEQLQLPESSPAENRQLAGSAAETDLPDDWVTQDIVPDRPGIDQYRWIGKPGPNSSWHLTTNSPYYKHGYCNPYDGTQFEVRCLRKDLPTKIAASDSPAPPSKKTDPRITVRIEVVTHNGSIVTSEHSTDDPSMTEAASLMGYCLRAVDNYLLKPRQDDAIEAFENSAFQ